MLSIRCVSVVVLACALLCWPAGVRRLALPLDLRRPPVPAPDGPVPPSPVPDAPAADRSWWWFTALGVAAIGGDLVGGLAVGAAVVMLCATVGSLAAGQRRSRRGNRELADLLAATRTLAREVRAGAAASAAVLATAAAHGGRVAGALVPLARAVVQDRGNVAPPVAVVGYRGSADAVAAEVTGRLLQAWSMSTRMGVPWASLVEAVALDLADRIDAATRREAQVAGPRVSGYVLAVMPALGVVLGIGMGADPVRVLLGTSAGHLLLLVGTSLTCLGLVWTARIVRG